MMDALREEEANGDENDHVEYAPHMPELVLPSEFGDAHGVTISTHDEDQPSEADDDEKQEIAAAIEHLIIQGNYCRHLQWRVDEWKRKQQSKNTGAGMEVVYDDDSSTATRDESDGTDENDDDLKPKAKRKRSEDDVHAQDSRLYNPDERYQGHDPDPWPKAPYTAARELCATDHKWDEELSDNLHPIAFSKMRLSSSSIVPPPNDPATTELPDDDDDDAGFGAEYDLDPSQSSCSVSKGQAMRAMLLQCWERAVHAAATTVEVVVSPLPHGAQERLQPPRTTEEPRTREHAIATWQRLRMKVPSWQLVNSDNDTSAPDHDSSQVNDTTIKCSVCDVPFSSVEKWQDHFFGTATIQGCCWVPIAHQRRNLLAQVLDSEVRTQLQQLLRVVLMDSLVGTGCDDTQGTTRANPPPLLDCFDVLRILENRLAASRSVVSTTHLTANNCCCKPAVSETTEVQMDEPPLPINAAMLEAVRVRLADRYARVPR
jgi:hypothetical protein